MVGLLDKGLQETLAIVMNAKLTNNPNFVSLNVAH
jgi:hypothetical protein